MRITKKMLDDLSYQVLGCAIEVHKTLGPGLLESVYEKCLLKEFRLNGIEYSNQVKVPLNYKGTLLETELRLDILVENILCVELKAQEGFLPIHEAVLLSYMHLLEKPKGILINFHSINIFKGGQKTLVNKLFYDLLEI
ncbi:MAG: GxxExxY protein [Saprospiraceae bacterium]|nr:GxxExxY protein [Saprospiraceae bacterium]MBK7738555.1 GxxExxY protein [Saprospiraceae bacterium]MBK7912873.1 GxxExxY protein [Saprospiraceae bacterium]